MKLTRRTFLGAIAAATLTAKDVFGFFRKKDADLRHEATVDYLKAHTQGAPHKSCTYIYNAGMDYEGILQHTFGNIGHLPGGKVTRIDQCEEWTLRGIHDWNAEGLRVYAPVSRLGRMLGMKPRFIEYRSSKGEQKRMEGLYRKERIRVQAPDPELPYELRFYEDDLQFEDRYIIVHPARDIADNLAISDRYRQLTVLRFWDNTEVDLDWVNKLIEADTLAARIAKVSALREEKEFSLLKLRASLLLVLAEHAQVLRLQLARNIAASAGGWGRMSLYEQRACKLLGVSADQWGRIVSDVPRNDWGPDVAWIERALPLWGVGRI